jgi:signal transduction histidine kinase
MSFKDGATRVFRVSDGLAVDDVRVIAENRSGDLWIGGYGGLTRIHNGRFTHWADSDVLPSNNIGSIYIDSDDVVWIGTYDGGLGRFDGDRFTRYSMRDGLFNNGVFQILEDGQGNLWMSCNRGIYRVSKQELNEFAAGKRSTITSVPYGKVDGMLNSECNGGYWPAGTKTKEGMLWFPSRTGVAVINPQAVSTNPIPPRVVIESFTIDRTPVRLDRPIRVTPDKENVEIQYTALSFIKSDQIRFKYMIEGLDTVWINAGSRRTAYYSHVRPGKYLFHVIAGNSDGIWNNEGKTLEVTFLAPFYQTWWFQLLMLLAIGAVFLVVWRYRMMQVERAHAVHQSFSRQLIASQENERKRIAAELHDSLGQRMVVIKNLVHFLLRSNKQSADSQDVQTLQEISDEAASAINETREISYNLRPFQLDRLGLTKAIEAMIRTVSAASGISISKEIDNIDDLFPEDLRINFYRIVQESLNNIMKHSQATEANVQVRRSGQSVTMTIEDNGRGFGPAEKAAQPSTNGFGLTGMAERTSLLGGEFKVRSMPGRGTVMTVEISQNGDNHG